MPSLMRSTTALSASPSRRYFDTWMEPVPSVTQKDSTTAFVLVISRLSQPKTLPQMVTLPLSMLRDAISTGWPLTALPMSTSPAAGFVPAPLCFGASGLG